MNAPSRHRRARRRSLVSRVREPLLFVLGLGGIGYERFIADEPRVLFVSIWLGFIFGTTFVLQGKVPRPLLTRSAAEEPAPEDEPEPTS